MATIDQFNNLTNVMTTVGEKNSLVTQFPQRIRDNTGRLKITSHQNVYEADFEYGAQPMRWENYIVGAATITPTSNIGGVQLAVTTAAGDVAIRQTRPYHRYQPGKTMYMATGITFGGPATNHIERVGFLDDNNGMCFQIQTPTATNPTGMCVMYRSDIKGVPYDTVILLNQWQDPYGVAQSLNWTQIQMLWMEFAWYGAGLMRWGVILNGEPYTLHQIGQGNGGQNVPWARTGNLPVRYELRNSGAVASAQTLNHWGVSVIVEGQRDQQRGFTYGYGMAAGTPTRSPGSAATRYPLLSLRYRPMGTMEYGVDSNYSGSNGTLPATGAAITAASSSATSSTVVLTGTPLTPNAWVGKSIFCRGATASITGITITSGVATATTAANPNYLTVGRWVIIAGATATGTINGQVQITGVTASTFTFNTTASGTVTGTITYQTGQGTVGRIIANTQNTLTVVDNVQGGPLPVLPASSGNYILGMIDRGQILPQTLQIYSSANCTLELISSTYSSPVTLTGASFATMYSLGSLNSFGERDVSATALTGGEVVYNAPLPSGGLQTYDLSQFFPLYNNVQGNQPDILTVAITTPSGFAGTVGASLIAQEAMS